MEGIEEGREETGRSPTKKQQMPILLKNGLLNC